MTGEERAPRNTKLVVIALVISVVASSMVLGAAIYVKSKQESELVDSLIQNCQRSPVRGALTEILTEEIEESHSPLTAKIAKELHLTPAELKEITGKSNAKKQERIEEIEPSDCEEQYK